MLRRAWAGGLPAPLEAVWSSRKDWDILKATPRLPEGCVILHLAGATRGPAVNDAAALAQAVCAQGARHVFLASSVAVYAPASQDLDEDTPPAPPGPYGAAKLAMERAVAGRSDVTCLRIANVAGADALLGGAQVGRAVTLDPVPGQAGGPIRSYIGPQRLAGVLAALALRAATGQPLPAVLNIATQPAVSMAALLQAAAMDWHFGPVNPAVVPRVTVSTKRLAALVPLPPADASALIADWRGLTGGPA